jgi:Tfp pilus assembly protein PilN
MFNRSFTAAVAGALFLLASMALSFGQKPDSDVQQEIETLKKGQQEILRRLQEIERLLQQQQRPARRPQPSVKGMVFDLGDNPAKGEQTAALTLVEFTDYQ